MHTTGPLFALPSDDHIVVAKRTIEIKSTGPIVLYVPIATFAFQAPVTSQFQNEAVSNANAFIAYQKVISALQLMHDSFEDSQYTIGKANAVREAKNALREARKRTA